MEGELSGLEARLGVLLQQFVRLRAENLELRQQVAAHNDERARLAARLAEARQRIEGLIRQLPEERTQKAA
jgi:cell division protein ZapB